MDDFFYYHPFWCILIIILIIVAVVFVATLASSYYCERILYPEITSLGYNNPKEVQIFCNRIGASLEDFIESPGLRKQYELFASGKTSDFIKTAEREKGENDARNAGLTTGIAIGTAIRAGK